MSTCRSREAPVILLCANNINNRIIGTNIAGRTANNNEKNIQKNHQRFFSFNPIKIVRVFGLLPLQCFLKIRFRDIDNFSTSTCLCDDVQSRRRLALYVYKYIQYTYSLPFYSKATSIALDHSPQQCARIVNESLFSLLFYEKKIVSCYNCLPPFRIYKCQTDFRYSFTIIAVLIHFFVLFSILSFIVVLSDESMSSQ